MIRTPYNHDPDFSQPSLQIPDASHQRIHSRLEFLYGQMAANQWMKEVERLLRTHHAHKSQEKIESEQSFNSSERFSEQDLVLITYGDAIKGNLGNHLESLHKFVETYYQDAFSTLHILPFFPYSSDRGFAVVDFKAVDPKLGTWELIRELGIEYNLMFDGVFNHCSSRSKMFREYLKGNPYYQDFFTAYDSPDELTNDQRNKIFRPRTSDILTKYHTINGPKYLWTTFSPDQIDLNFRNPAVLLFIIEAFLFYIRRGAKIIRLDAVTYLWTEPGTECIHLPETHAIIKLLRDIMDIAAPNDALITETNVSHEQNIAYFGNGCDEAHMVYNFALPPLVIHSFYNEDASILSEWAQGPEFASERAIFFNILDTHDGIGLMGVEGILSPDQIDKLTQQAERYGSHISYKSSAHGKRPYEINSTWWSTINQDDSSETVELQVKRYIASRSISLVLKGVPGIYTHGALGLANCFEMPRKTGNKRDINRGLIDPDLYADQLRDPKSKRALLRKAYDQLLKIRTRHRAFHPLGEQRVLLNHACALIVLRVSPEREQFILTLTNVSARSILVDLPQAEIGITDITWEKLVGDGQFQEKNSNLSITLPPYDILWLLASNS